MSQSSVSKTLIVGRSKSGKSSSMRNLDHVLYLNCEAGKRLPFNIRNKELFTQLNITNVYQLPAILQALAGDKKIKRSDGSIFDLEPYKYLVVDGLNYLMDLFYQQVVSKKDSYDGWAAYKSYFSEFVQVHMASSPIPVFVIGHAEVLYEGTRNEDVVLPLQGSMKGKAESYFTEVVSAKVMPLAELDAYIGDDNHLLTVNESEKRLQYKHVFQVMKTPDTLSERISTPQGMFSIEETFIDNDVAILNDRIVEYYGDEPESF